MQPISAMTEEKKSVGKSWLDAWHVSPSVNRDYDFIDGMRGIAILMVVVGHHFYVNPNSRGATRFLGAIIGTGGYGVTLFYALSGFLISWAFWKRKVSNSRSVVPQGYGQRRFWKIYPPLFLSILVLAPLYVLANSDWCYLALAAKWLVGWAFILPVSGKLNPVMWTLVIEVQFYITLPLLFLCFRKISAKTTLAVVTTLFLLVPLLMRVVMKESATYYPNIDPHYPSALDAFCFGILIAGLDNLGLIKRSWVRWGVAGSLLWPLALLAAAWVSIYHPEQSMLRMEVLHACLRFSAACLIFFIAQPQHPIARFLCAPWLRWCGIISYEWYLFHQPLAIWSRSYFGPASGNVVKYAVVVGLPLIVGLVVSAIVYRVFSLPLLRYGRDKNRH
jgi:peptidoglycan/LPS O-acetylase OafA/YrhL